MLKLTDALTGGACYVRSVDGIAPGWVFEGQAFMPGAGQKPCTWVYSNGAVMNVRETPDEIAKAASERWETDLLCDELLYGTPGDNAKQAKRHGRQIFVGREAAPYRDALDAIWRLMCGEKAALYCEPGQVYETVRAMLKHRTVVSESVHFPNANYKTLDGYEKMRAALDSIWALILGNGQDRWREPQDVVDEVLHLVGTNDDLSERAAADGHDGCTDCATHTCMHDNGCAHGHQANDVSAATEGDDASVCEIDGDVVIVNRDCDVCADDGPFGKRYLVADVELTPKRMKALDAGKALVVDVNDEFVTRVVKHGAVDVGAVISREVKRLDIPLVSHASASLVRAPKCASCGKPMVDATPTEWKCVNAKCAEWDKPVHVRGVYPFIPDDRPNGAHPKTDDEPGIDRLGCYTTDPVSASGCSKPISMGCDGCVANPLQNPTDALRVPADLLTGEYNANTARASMLMRDPATGITVATDPTIPPDEVVMRSHTVDGKLLDEVRAVNVGTDPSGTDPFAGLCEKMTESSGRSVLEPGGLPIPLCVDCGARECPDDDPCDEVSDRASDVTHGLDTKEAVIVRFLADRDPQTTLRLAGACIGDERMTDSLLEALEVLCKSGLVMVVDRLPHDDGKPLMDRWTLTTLGREVARVLARG